MQVKSPTFDYSYYAKFVCQVRSWEIKLALKQKSEDMSTPLSPYYDSTLLFCGRKGKKYFVHR